jgi:hypothetical protein
MGARNPGVVRVALPGGRRVGRRRPRGTSVDGAVRVKRRARTGSPQSALLRLRSDRRCHQRTGVSPSLAPVEVRRGGATADEFNIEVQPAALDVAKDPAVAVDLEEKTDQLNAIRERADSQQERADIQQERIQLAARELVEVSLRLQPAANALGESI